MTREELERDLWACPTSKIAALRLLLRKAMMAEQTWWHRWLWWLA